jgi:hypothetical protein
MAAIDHIMDIQARFKINEQDAMEIVKFLDNNKDLSDGVYMMLYEYFHGDMPYGVAKARTGDPICWIGERLDADYP